MCIGKEYQINLMHKGFEWKNKSLESRAQGRWVLMQSALKGWLDPVLLFSFPGTLPRTPSSLAGLREPGWSSMDYHFISGRKNGLDLPISTSRSQETLVITAEYSHPLSFLH